MTGLIDDPRAIWWCRVCGEPTVPRTDLCRLHLTGEPDAKVLIDNEEEM